MVVVVQLLIAESYGGRDEPVDALVANLVDIGVIPIMDPLRVKDTPTEQTYQVLPVPCMRKDAPCASLQGHCRVAFYFGCVWCPFGCWVPTASVYNAVPMG